MVDVSLISEENDFIENILMGKFDASKNKSAKDTKSTKDIESSESNDQSKTALKNQSILVEIEEQTKYIDDILGFLTNDNTSLVSQIVKDLSVTLDGVNNNTIGIDKALETLGKYSDIEVTENDLVPKLEELITNFNDVLFELNNLTVAVNKDIALTDNERKMAIEAASTTFNPNDIRDMLQETIDVSNERKFITNNINSIKEAIDASDVSTDIKESSLQNLETNTYIQGFEENKDTYNNLLENLPEEISASLEDTNFIVEQPQIGDPAINVDQAEKIRKSKLVKIDEEYKATQEDLLSQIAEASGETAYQAETSEDTENIGSYLTSMVGNATVALGIDDKIGNSVNAAKQNIKDNVFGNDETPEETQARLDKIEVLEAELDDNKTKRDNAKKELEPSQPSQPNIIESIESIENPSQNMEANSGDQTQSELDVQDQEGQDGQDAPFAENNDTKDSRDARKEDRRALKKQKAYDAGVQKKEFKHDNKNQKRDNANNNSVIDVLERINESIADVEDAIWATDDIMGGPGFGFGKKGKGKGKGKGNGKSSGGNVGKTAGTKPSRFGKIGGALKNVTSSIPGKGLGLAKVGGAALALGMGAYNFATAESGDERIDAASETGGALAGAAAGAAIGSVIPVVGTIIGGLIGGVVGAYGGGMIGDMFKDPQDSIPDKTKELGPSAEIDYINSQLIPEMYYSIETGNGKYTEDDLKTITEYKQELITDSVDGFDDLLDKAELGDAPDKAKFDFISKSIEPLKESDPEAYKGLMAEANSEYNDTSEGFFSSGISAISNFVSGDSNKPSGTGGISESSSLLSSIGSSGAFGLLGMAASGIASTFSKTDSKVEIPKAIDQSLDSYIESGIESPAILSTVVPDATPEMINQKLGIQKDDSFMSPIATNESGLNLKTVEKESSETTIINNNGGGQASIQTTDPKTNNITNSGTNIMSLMM